MGQTVGRRAISQQPPIFKEHSFIMTKDGCDTTCSTISTIAENGLIELQPILSLIRIQTGFNLSLYKPNTLIRQIEKRLNILQLNTLSEYTYYLYQHRDEATFLFKSVLIHVSHFFRDKDAFELIKSELLIRLLKKKQSHDFRVWVPGCSTGEEAYSIAIILQECMTALNHHVKVRIFATDIDLDSIESARKGVFLPSIEKHVSPERLQLFFNKEESGYRVSRKIRDMIVFAVQNIIEDPPFLKLDFVSCRNLLIYLQSDVQLNILSLFHNSLNIDGLILLGPSENLNTLIAFFNTIIGKWRVYERRISSPVTRITKGWLSAIQLLKTTDVNMTDNLIFKPQPLLATVITNLLVNPDLPPLDVINEILNSKPSPDTCLLDDLPNKLQSSINELRSSNEELQAINEELQATNEALQASNQ